MSDQIKDGGPAFPLVGVPFPDSEGHSRNPYDGYGWAQDPQAGMTLRDYFAAKALPSVFLDFQTSVRNGECESHRMWKSEIAAIAYGMADAMLAARESQS